MADIYPKQVVFPRSALGWDGTAHRELKVDDGGQLQVDVASSGLPAGAATEATLNTASGTLTGIKGQTDKLTFDALAGSGYAVRGSLISDRSAKDASIEYNADLTDHEPIDRASYTVPTGKAALVHCVFIATGLPASTYVISDWVNIRGKKVAQTFLNASTPLHQSMISLPLAYYLLAGQTVTIGTYQTDTAECRHTIDVHITEFDA